ncbi:VCBS domain-containing protein [Achromobacter sp. NFACC18-2]|uniref:VCBS domain-containing protein n=1 Tax=Achromobacter sp. NFACC18-2 TaxID=1564112 RepID=UPI0008BC0921|nr:VCBS domain-containing protein [Achromobacter sp. NFACC18-2]SEJ27034.1 conserved repeat domain-containing protein/fimbrial isopeptide formation D2 domain-containing protein [Achromobacter sp. NFACC18-2]
MSTTPIFRPVARALALEPRLLYDAAAAVAADRQQTDSSAHDTGQADNAAPAQGKNLLVIDGRLAGAQALADSATPGTKVLVVNPSQDGVAAVRQALEALGTVDSIQILSHGTPGQMTLGNSVLTAQSADTQRAADWGAHLSTNADILLYGCGTGSSASGQELMGALASATGADVAASTNDTGNPSVGGDWDLEVATGSIESQLQIGAAALAAYDGLLADALPTLALGGSSADILLGDTAQIQAIVSNPSAQEGYAPFIDILIPATGYDGDDGVSFVSASTMGITLNGYVITFGADGTAEHPLAKDATGNPVVLQASQYGYRPGDQLVVLALPYAGFGKDQPTIAVDIVLGLSPLADVNKDHTVSLRAGFQYGNDALDNPEQDPALFEADWQTYALRSTPFEVTQSLDMTEGETATGENYPHTLTVTATPAPGQTLQNVAVVQQLPDSIRVLGITPGSGGILTRLTLADGRVLSDTAAINAALALKPYVTSYEISYASLSGPADTLVRFFVAETTSGGQQVLDPASGAPRQIEVAQAFSTGQWTPLDPRDVPDLLPWVPVIGRGEDVAFTAKAVALHKTVEIDTDSGVAGLSPGDVLSYQYDVTLSDYFAIGKSMLGQGSLTITDTLGDGLTFAGTPMLTFTQDGQQYTVALIYTLGEKTATGTQIVFDLAASIAQAGLSMDALIGDIASDGTRQSATRATINYDARVDEAYQGSYAQAEINEGDSLSNSALLAGTIIQSRLNVGAVQSDGSEVTVTVPTGNVDIAVFQVNGSTVPPSYELQPGDIVTFVLRYDLQTGDYENLKLTAYLPAPVFEPAGSWSVGIGDHRWSYGPGDTHPGTVVGVSSQAGGALVFDFGDYAMQGDPSGQNRIEVLFTLRVSGQPFADQRSITVLGQSSQQTTVGHAPVVDTDNVLIQSVAEPVLTIGHGVVGASGGTVSGATGDWNPPGSTGAGFNGSVTDLAALEGAVTGMDAGDILRLATGIENRGGGGAYDVTVNLQVPAGLAFLGGSLDTANLRIARGDGTVLVLEQDYSVSGTTITFLDAGGQASLLAGRPGTAADDSGQNMVVITYDVVASSNLAASSTLQSTAILTHYASVEGGSDFTPTDLADTADAQSAAPVITKGYADGSLDPTDSSASHTSGSNLVIGERMLYDIVVTLPEGTTQNLRLSDLIPEGFALDTAFGLGGYQLITQAALSGSLAADFGGMVSIASLTGSGGTLGANGVDMVLTFSASSALANNNQADNSFVIRLGLIATNVTGNQAGQTLTNDASLTYTDPDGDTPNGATSVDRSVAATGGLPSVTIVEPTLTVSHTAVTDGSSVGVDRGDHITYTITVGNGSAASDVDAFDVRLSDVLPSELSGVEIVGVTLYGGATLTGGDFIIQNGVLQLDPNAKLDIPKGGSLVLQFRGTLNDSTGTSGKVDNEVTVQWTSLNGVNGGERTGADGSLGSGALNDYRLVSVHSEDVAASGTISHVGGLTDTAGGSPTTADPQDVAIGEIVHYRVALLVPEGTQPDAAIRVYLPPGLTFMNDGSAMLAYLANALANGSPGLWTDMAGLIVSGDPNIDGGVTDKESTLLNPDLSGVRAEGVLNTAAIDTADPRVIVLRLGNLVNANQDSDFEGLYFEFNARVDNAAGVAAGGQLAVRAEFLSGSEVRFGTETVTERVVEPKIDDVQKSVVSFDPGAGGTVGQAGYEVAFGNAGTATAYDVVLTDTLPTGGQNLTVTGLTIDGTTYAPGGYPPGVSVVVSGGTVTVSLDTLVAGASVSLAYSADLPNNTPLADTSATVTYTSLPTSFQSFAGTQVGAAGTVGGERTGSGTGPNTYRDGDAAGLSRIDGTLWNDTDSATGSATPDGPGLAGQTVTLTWGGADNDLSTATDNRSWTVTTDVNGYYYFGVLGPGVFRIDAPPTVTVAGPTGVVNARIDSDGASAVGQVQAQFGDLGAAAAGNVGYVERNDGPVNTVPGAQALDEDTSLAITGISIADPDSGAATMQVTLNVLHGGLTLTLGSVELAAGALGSGMLQLRGSRDALNAALATLVYSPGANYNGNDRLTILTEDLGQRGDADGDGTPFEPVDDNLTDTDAVDITVRPVNDAPQGVDDTAHAVEAGGVGNDVPGIDPAGNVLDNDIDVDIETNGDVLTVTQASGIAGPVTVDPLSGEAMVAGQYGTLFINAQGGYRYVVNNTDPDVQELLASSTPLQDTFTYTLRDSALVSSSARLVVTLTGANDAPTAVDDAGIAQEKGGTANASGGSPASGNVLDNDSDVDGGDTRSVTLARNATDTRPGPALGVPAGSTAADGAIIEGRYGTLRLGADGSYVYTVDDNNATVQALNQGDVLLETFDYAVTDAGGLNAIASLVISIEGANDNPVAVDNLGEGYTASVDAGTGTVIGVPRNPQGNVITDAYPDDDPGAVDSDVDNDMADAVVHSIGPEGGSQADVTPGVEQTVAGLYGVLRMNSDGSYVYEIDSLNPTLVALGPDGTVDERFVYGLEDADGGRSTAVLTIRIHGVSDQPVASNIVAIAQERGGVGNATPGRTATGDVTVNDIDPDGDDLTVTGARSGAEAEGGSMQPIGAPILGKYGTLTLMSDGTFSYALNETDETVQALRTAGNTLVDVFTYTLSDTGGLTDQAELRVRILGQNDAPEAADDAGSAVEAGGTGNTSGGRPAQGNVLANDKDVDSAANGEALTVAGVRAGDASGGAVPDATGPAMVITGSYGTLTLLANGAYVYRVDNANPAVQALPAGASIFEDFTYKVRDVGGLEDTATLRITIAGANDAPEAQAQAIIAVEKGGTGNDTGGLDPSGNLLPGAGSDPDTGDTLHIVGLRAGQPGDGTAMQAAGTTVQGRFGTLRIDSDGSYVYTVDNTLAAVQALRLPTDILVEHFTFRLSDAAGLNSDGLLTVTIRGADDAPVARDDTGSAVEAGGTDNQTPGSPAIGNVLSNDRDVDARDQSAVSAVQNSQAQAGVVGGAAAGLYGTLYLQADGSYRYEVDDTLAAVQQLRAGQSLQETYTYTVRDLAGLTHTATLTITIAGSYDAPVADDDTDTAVPATSISPAVDAQGNVLANDGDVDAGDTKAVIGIRAGAGTHGFTSVTGTAPLRVDGMYGWLEISADGSYTYHADETNEAVAALAVGESLLEVFTYRAVDGGGLTDQAELRITIQGVNDPPVATPVVGIAIEQGVRDNEPFQGRNPSGDVTLRDFDAEGRPLTVVAIRTGTEAGTGTSGTVGSVLRGAYGDLIINADGTYSYVLDNSLDAVNRLRLPTDTLLDVFTYTIADDEGQQDSATMVILILGQNDAPVAHDDVAEAVEAGGLNNTEPGIDPSGNVLANDTDVDAGDGKTVLAVGLGESASGTVGRIAGLYGTLVMDANGAYQYVVDNDNPLVQALRTPGETLTEVFTYAMRDTAGAVAQARLIITISGRDDTPQARDDSAYVDDVSGPPIVQGNVLPNDSDVDGGDAIAVTGIRPQQDVAAAGQVGERLAGRYGFIVMNADGSYRYEIDLSNPDVQAARGRGPILQDVFVYTISDLAGRQSEALLTIVLKLDADYVAPPNPYALFGQDTPPAFRSDLTVDPVVYVTPAVRDTLAFERYLDAGVRGQRPQLAMPPEITLESLAAGLGEDHETPLTRTIQALQWQARYQDACMQTRYANVFLSADGLLRDDSVFTYKELRLPETGRAHAANGRGEPPRHGAGSFSDQIRVSASDAWREQWAPGDEENVVKTERGEV